MPPTDAQRLKTWQARVFSATWLSYAGYYFCRKPFYAAKPILAKELGWDPGMLGAIGAAYLIAYACGQFIAAWAGDRYGPRALVLTGMGTTAAANASFGFTNSYAMFMTLMVVNGLAQATGWAGNVGAMAPWFRRTERGSVMGLWATNFQVGGVAATALAAFLLDLRWTVELGGTTITFGGLRWSFMGGTVVLLAIWAYFAFNQRNRPEDVGLPPVEADNAGPAGPLDSGRDVWTRDQWVNVGLLGGFYFFVKFVRYALLSWSPFLLFKYYGLKASEAGYLSTIFEVAGVAGVIGLGVLSDRVFGGRRILPAAGFIALMVVGCVLLYAVGDTGLAMYAICTGIIGFALFGPDAILTSASAIDVGSASSAAKAAGIINGLGAIGSVAQEFLVGRLLDSGSMGPVFAALVITSLCAFGSLLFILRRNKTGRSNL